jgi:hypothetical protein
MDTHERESEVTVKEFLDSLPEEKREDMADFLYNRIPCRYGLRNITALDSQQPLPFQTGNYPSAFHRNLRHHGSTYLAHKCTKELGPERYHTP